MPKPDDDTTASNVTIACVHCGREIWQEAAGYLTLADARRSECSDCVMDRALKSFNENANRPARGTEG